MLRTRLRLEALEDRTVPVANLWNNHVPVAGAYPVAPLWSVGANWLQYNDPTPETEHHAPSSQDYLQFDSVLGSPNSSVVDGAYTVDRIDYAGDLLKASL